MLILRDGWIVSGDGESEPLSGSVLVEGGRIAAVEARSYSGGLDDQVIDLHGSLVMPGAVDVHAHAVAPGPRFASGTPGVSLEEAMGNLRRHMAQGHTTVVDLDGFKVPSETAEVRSRQPVRVESATVHFDPMWAVADATDGTGLSPMNREMTAAAMAEQGACVIGEVGAGMTLGGGGQDYMYIPAAIYAATGRRLRAREAAALKYAVLGRHVKPGSPDRKLLKKLLLELRLSQKLTVDGVVKIIEDSVLPPFRGALEGIVKAAQVANELGLPALVHNSAPSDEACREAAVIAGSNLIAGHTNHGTFTRDEAIASATWMKQHEAYVEVNTFDSWGLRELEPSSAMLLALVGRGLADIIATDYAAGHWDGVYEAVEDIWRSGAQPLKTAVAMATGNVAKAVPRIGGSRGLLRAGYLADLVVSHSRHPSLISLVVIGGEVVFEPVEPVPYTREAPRHLGRPIPN